MTLNYVFNPFPSSELRMRYIFRLDGLSYEDRIVTYEWVYRNCKGKTFKYQTQGYPPQPKVGFTYTKPECEKDLLWTVCVGFDDATIAMHFKLMHPICTQYENKTWEEIWPYAIGPYGWWPR